MQEKAIGEITPYPKNAKEHKDKQIKKIAASITEFGFNQPIVVDKEGMIVVGHGRYFAALSLKLSTVPVLVADNLSDEQIRAYRLADNKLNESEWDMDLVVEELKSMSLQMVDLTGFDANLTLETEEDDPDLSTVGTPKSVEGDVYELGEHKLICGDSTKAETYAKLLGDERARLIFTDPPYSIDYQSGGGLSYDSTKFGGTGGRIFNDDKTPAEALTFYQETLQRLHEFSTPDVTLYWWFATRLTDINFTAIQTTKWHFSQIIFWLKNSLIYSPGQLYHRIYEPCIVAWKQDGEPHYQNLTFSKFSELWTVDQKTFAEHLDVWYNKRDNTNKYIHPTQKPVRLAERALKRSSQQGDIVLDAFGGSGSILISCEQLGRKCRMIELDGKYVDACVTRYCQFKDDFKIIKNGQQIDWVA